MTQTIALLGRQPALGLAELESLYGAEKLKMIGSQAALLDQEPAQVNFGHLGGVIKLAKLLTILDTTDWHQIEKFLLENVIPHTTYLPQGKMNLGLSVYGLPVKAVQINATALELKKHIRNGGKSVRVIPNKTPELSSAQVLHNDLTGERSWELLFIKHGAQTYVAQTVAVQDINAYAARDQNRPKRDARVGMLPPKLAQIIINLANPLPEATVLDPFCGTGVVLQEALLMGLNAYGSDIDTRMVEYAATNIDWLRQKYPAITGLVSINQGDATSYNWPTGISAIAAETYLGRAFSAEPKAQVLDEVMRDVDTIHKKFLQNVTRQTKPGFCLSIAVPAWKTKNGFKHLKTLDNLEQLGYTRTVFAHVDTQDLVYHRPEQVVARELVVLTRK